MTIKEHYNELQKIRVRLEKASKYKSKYKDLDVLLALVESQATCFIVWDTMGKKDVDDFGGFRLINSMLNEWEKQEEQEEQEEQTQTISTAGHQE